MGTPRRLIIVPQLPVKMRYQQWLGFDVLYMLSEMTRGTYFDEYHTLHGPDDELRSAKVLGSEFSNLDRSMEHEAIQISQYLALNPGPQDTLLHLDLSFPGLFHSVLLHKRPGKSVVFCHASARNRYDVFADNRSQKWRSESLNASLYNKVLVASNYHKSKLGWKNVNSLGGLPDPPPEQLPPPSNCHRDLVLCSVSRSGMQKTTRSIERAVEKLTGLEIHRPFHSQCQTWFEYYQFLDRCRFMLITSKEETYGYQARDARLRGCIPICPNAYSFPEFIPTSWTYDPTQSPEKIARRVQEIIDHYEGCDNPPPVDSVSNRKGFYQRLVHALIH